MSAPLQFDHPASLLLLLALVWVYRQHRRSVRDPTVSVGAGRGRWRVLVGRLPLLVRTTVVVLLVLGLSGVSVLGTKSERTVILVLDESESIVQNQRDAALERLRRGADSMKQGDRAGLVVFGKDALVEAPPGRDLSLSAIRSDPDPTRTDIAGALRLASAMLADAPNPGIVLVSDGNENAGDALTQAALVAGLGIQVDVVPLLQGDDPTVGELALEDVSAPRHVRTGEPFEVTANVHGSQGDRVTLRLLLDDAEIAARSASLSRAKRDTFRFTQRLEQRGFHRFGVIIEGPGDRLAADTEAEVLVHAAEGPRVLFLGRSKAQRMLAEILERRGFEIHTAPTSPAPDEALDLASYEALILENLPADGLSGPQMDAVAEYVDGGGGLIALGGGASFGPGGFANTTIETVLPVELGGRDRQRDSELALVLMIDKSGSMAAEESGLSKLKAAKDAAGALLDLLEPGDLFGAIAFDRDVSSAMEIRDASDRPAIEKFLDSLRAGGETVVDPAVETAYAWLEAAPRQRRHALLLSDGQAERGSLERLAPLVARSDISFSAVGIGSDVDRDLLTELAKIGGGRAYMAEDTAELPAIFARETARIKGQWFVERRFKPRARGDHPVMRGIDGSSLPMLGGYVAARPKATARMILVSDREDPILSGWRFGLGRAAALTMDVVSPGGVPLLKWESFDALWVQLVRWVARRPGNETLQPQVALEGDTAEVVVDAFRGDGGYADFLDVRCIVRPPAGEPLEIRLAQNAAGSYRGRFDVTSRGTYLLRFMVSDDRALEAASTHVSFHVPRLPEHRNRGGNPDLLREIARATNGSLLAEGQETFRGTGPPRAGYIDVSRPASVAALFVFLLDVVIRRRLETRA